MKNSLPVTATDSNGQDLNASAYIIEGEEKDDLLSRLEETDLIESVGDVDALVEVESDDFDGLAETTFDVSDIAQTGDKVVILHFNEETQEWEFVAEKTVDENGNVTADFSSYSPVAFVVVKTDGTMTPVDGTTYEYGDYLYTYDIYSDGWYVKLNTAVTDKNQTSYGPILESVYGAPVKHMANTFKYCASMVTAPEIPSGVVSMQETFYCCRALTTAPAIPSGVQSMSSTFEGCTSLTFVPDMSNVTSLTYMFATFDGCTSLVTAPALPNGVQSTKNVFCDCTALKTAPVIPASVTDMFGTFWNCTSLTGTVTINANPTSYGWCFRNVDFAAQNLTLAGTSTMLDAIGADGSSNYCNNCNGVCVE